MLETSFRILWRGAGSDLAERTVEWTVDPLNLIQITLAEGCTNMVKHEKLFETKVLAEIIVFAALSVVLYALTLPFLTLPFGGSVTAGSMVPIIWLSMRRGAKVGVIGGVVFGLAALAVDVIRLPYSPILVPAQVLLDYPVPFGAIGLAGFFKPRSSKDILYALIGVAVATLGRFVSHFVSGVFFWITVWEVPLSEMIVISVVYNGSFLIGEFIIAAIILSLLVKRGVINVYP
jgi:thiamine transporter